MYSDNCKSMQVMNVDIRCVVYREKMVSCYVICCPIPSTTSFGGRAGGEGVTSGLGLGRWLTSKTTTVETANTPKATVLKHQWRFGEGCHAKYVLTALLMFFHLISSLVAFMLPIETVALCKVSYRGKAHLNS